jgi:diadenosine tetraphosphatase ApaH/serine/threonine PP2A family protein phosphatase
LEIAIVNRTVVGHSHVPFIRRIGGKVIVNPGSVGQPRSGDARASYAVWDDGEFILRKAHYPVETTIARLKLLGFKETVEQELAACSTGACGSWR